MKEKTCCFTGHRSIPAAEHSIIMRRTEKHIRALIQSGVMFFGVGGAIGYDTEAAQLLFRLRILVYISANTVTSSSVR